MVDFFLKILVFLFLSSSLAAQEFNYVHYDTKEGLPGSVVYDMCEAKDGFIWFATENGLSRYDGTSFKNFTVKDGLPENEVLKVFSDSKGRLWIATFSKEICFYYNGKIYNKSNTAWLSKIVLRNVALTFCEDETGALLISDFIEVIKIDPGNRVSVLTDKPMFKKYKGQIAYVFTNYFDGGFFISFPHACFKIKKDHLEKFYSMSHDLSDKFFVLKYFPDGRFNYILLPDTWITPTFYKHTAIFASTVNGAWSIDTGHFKLQTHFLPGKKISHTIKDIEGNIWFSTIGEGVYRLSSLEMKNINFPSDFKMIDKEIFSIAAAHDHILLGLSFSKMGFVEKDHLLRIINYDHFTKRSTNNSSVNKVTAVKTFSNGDILVGSDAFLVNKRNSEDIFRNLTAVKSIDEIDSGHAVVGTYSHVYKVATRDLNIIDTIYNGRSTKIFYEDHTYYIGTLHGLYQIDENKKKIYLGDVHPSLARRITDIVAGKNSIVWVATNDAGVVAFKKGKVISAIQEKDGLSSNICKALFFGENFLWVGTNKGLNKIDLKNGTIIKYSASDGLPSDLVNALLVKDSIVYIGSPKGLTYFNENTVSSTSICNLKMLNVAISGKNYASTLNYQLSYKDNNIAFEYVAISFKSGGDIVYHYKLSGLDTAWQTTNQTSLVYQILPSGDYTLHLYAVNKFGQKSKTYRVNFSISTPFWKTWWAYALGILSIVFITAYLFNRRHKLLQQRLQEKSNFQKQFATLEQQALQAQMNPHFIFNCLNSIQQYILTNNKEKANQYLTGFASLIRRTLYISGKKSIAISEEISFLSDYLGMEQMRFGDTFVYELWVAKTINTELMEMPPLLLQPYVENALRHGIRHMQNGIGKVIVSFDLIEDTLVCCISDNGVGREKAAMYKNKLHIEYQSKGMSLTEKRVELINKINDRQIFVKVTDLHDTQGKATGTEVVVQIPV